MKTINLAGIIILGLALSSNEDRSVEAQKVCIPVISPKKIEKEVVVEPKEPTTDNFSRPRKPCPPSGPGRK